MSVLTIRHFQQVSVYPSLHGLSFCHWRCLSSVVRNWISFKVSGVVWEGVDTRVVQARWEILQSKFRWW